jgi:EpsI family protein
MREWQRYLPASVLGAGCLLMGTSTTQQRDMPLAAPLASLPQVVSGYQGADRMLSAEERRVAGVSAYLFRAFTREGSQPDFTVYVGYYDQQLQGKTIHSPKNCLPGSGWEVVSSSEERLPTPTGAVDVNRYVLVNEHRRAVVYYWYQGRGRVEGNEYRVKLQLLRDSAFRGRSDDALVRVVVPVVSTDSSAAVLGRKVSAELVPELFKVLPG